MSALETNQRDFVIVAMVEPARVGQQFSEWPLHITMMSWFPAADERAVREVCLQALKDIQPFTVEVGERDYFGPQRKLAVKRIKSSDDLQHLHEKLLDALKAYGIDVQGRYIGSLYTPHVTRHHGRDAEGQINVSELWIVEKLAQGYRKVVDKVRL